MMFRQRVAKLSTTCIAKISMKKYTPEKQCLEPNLRNGSADLSFLGWVFIRSLLKLSCMIFISSQLCVSRSWVSWEVRIAPGDHVKTAATTFFGPTFFVDTEGAHQDQVVSGIFFSKHVPRLESLRKKRYRFFEDAWLFQLEELTHFGTLWYHEDQRSDTTHSRELRS